LTFSSVNSGWVHFGHFMINPYQLPVAPPPPEKPPPNPPIPPELQELLPELGICLETWRMT
jgi:hypothetical protein